MYTDLCYFINLYILLILVFIIYLNLEKSGLKAEMMFLINLFEPGIVGNQKSLIMNTVLMFDPVFIDPSLQKFIDFEN